ncbi:unnamed protein product [Spodoptera exigua]|nr:unnamed protein product [Spodoptera exigua]
MVAAGVQTNGYTVGVRRLTKSFSEVGGDRLAGRDSPSEIATTVESFITSDHEKLHRTQSEEPPRSPRSPTAMIMPSSPLQRVDSDDVTSSSVKSVASSSQIDKSSELSALQRQAQEYFQQNFQFIHESDRDDTIDDDIENLEKSMALNRRNLEYLQQEIAKQSKGDKSLRSILSKSTSDASQKTINSSHPFSKTSTFQSEPSTETSATTTDDSEKNEKEIIIDFEPRPDDEAIPFTTLRRKNRRMLQKTLSEGEILLDVRKTELQTNGDGIKDAPIVMSTSQENMTREDREREAMYTQYVGQNYSQTPIKDEGIFGFEPDGSFSTARSSPGSPEPVTIEVDVDQKVKRAVISNTVTTILTPLDKVSPCASNESLTVDQSRDHSDGLWNESQTTVLQVDSGTENGTVISSSDLSSLAASPGALALLTPTSRRKQLLLLQHQQRSSLDTDALDEEFDASQSQSPTSPRNKLDTSSSSSQARASLSPPAVVPNITLPITKQPTISKSISPIVPPKVNHTPAIAITHPSLDLADVPFKRTPSFINKKRERALSPSRRKDLQKKAQQKEPNGTIPHQIVESPSEPPLAKAASSETSLARTDSGKINTTDVSESTTTTEDYVTANSDSSKKSNSKNQNQHPENNKTQEGSSFESASSLYSSTRTENIAEDMVLPSFSPPLEINDDFIVPDLASPPLPLPDRLPRVSMEKIEVKADITPTIEHIKREKTDIKIKDNLPKVSKNMRGTISGKSSSSGSYSIGGSNPNVTEDADDKTPTEKIVELPERSDSKGKEDKTTATVPEKEQHVPKMMGSLSDDERSVHYSSSGYYESPVDDDDDGGLTYKHSQRYKSSTRPKSWLADEKRRKKKGFTLEFSKSYDDSVSTSQDDWGKKPKDPDSISQKSERSIFKPSNVKSPQDEKAPETRKKKTHFADKAKSVQSSPRDPVDIEKSIKEKNMKEKEDGKFAKAASAESLRSVSPGSDSVFYSEQTEHSLVGADGESKAHCLHCGKEVHIVTATHEHDSVASRTSHTDESYADATPDIVPAPAGFADSPSCASTKKHASGARLYKKLDKRYRSEDKSRHYYRNRQDVRAKSEERGKEEYASSEKTQDTRIARSAGNSLDKLGGSSASVDPDEHEECSGSSEGAEGSRDEKGIYAAPWWCGNWIMLSENNDQWTRIPPDVIDTGSEAGQEDPTVSESEFNKRYVALTHRLVHRRACIELNRRQAENTFVKDMLNSKGSIRQKLEEILKLMLMLWCRQSQISRLVAPEPCESDKTVVVRRGNEEFGFRIHGSKPVVVSAIEPDTPAETSGLEVGDIVIAVNGINVLDKTHSEVVKIAHSGSEILELEVARTCEVVASLAHEGGPAALYSGYLWRAAPARPHHPPRWTRRWFVLKRDNCLYYYKTDSSIHPVGALMLVNYQLTEEDAGRPHGFRLHRGGGVRLQLAADTSEAAARWRAVLAHAIDASNQRDGWLEVTMRNMKLPPSSIPRPDCFGYLMKLGSKWKSWAKRYCVLKDACLYFYNDGNSKNAFVIYCLSSKGMACLHGYRIQTCAPGGKKYAFEVMPTEPKQRHFYFHTESEMDRKRWMAALEYSIDRWMKAG